MLHVINQSSMFISIEGNIGSGKSTLAQALAKKLKATYLPEQFEENVLLSLLYSDSSKFAFPTEYAFLIDRHKQLINYFKNKKTTHVTVSDFHFDKCLCFAKTNLAKTDYAFYKKHFKALQQTVKQPDVIIYLKTEIPHLISNIKKRSRKDELNMKESYLVALQKQLDSYYLKKLKSAIKPIAVTIEKYDSKTMEQLSELIIKDYLNKSIL